MNSKIIRSRVVAGCVVAVVGTMSLPAVADVSLTPRVGIYFDNTDQRESVSNRLPTFEDQAIFASYKPLLDQLGIKYFVDAPDQVKRSSPSAIPQYGGTFTFDWRGDSATQIALTALYGSADTESGTLVRQQFARFDVPVLPLIPTPLRFTDTSVETYKYEGRTNRLDLEGTVQHRLNETFSLIAGVRVERRETDFQMLVQGTYSSNFSNFIVDYLARLRALQGLPPTNGPVYLLGGPPLHAKQSIDFTTYSARLGAAAYAPVGEKHLFYVNGLLQLSRTEASDYNSTIIETNFTSTSPGFSDTSIGPDISVGYMYRLSDRFGFDVRYRATIYFPVAGDFDFEDSRVKHGLGIGFTTWFGGR